MKTPIWVSAQLFPSLVGLINGFEECRGVCRVNDYWDAKSSAGIPNRIKAFVVDLDETTVGISIAEAELFKNLESACAFCYRLLNLFGSPLCETGLMAGPRSGLIAYTSALPVNIRVDHKAVLMTLP